MTAVSELSTTPRERSGLDPAEIFSVRGRRIVVTGGAQGIGAAMVQGLAAQGANVVVLDLDGPALDSAAASTDDTGGGLIGAVAADMRVESAVESAFDSAAEMLDGIDVVFANAGVAGTVGRLDEWSLEDWRQVMAVNLDGAFLTARAATRRMVPLSGKKLIFTASVWGQRGSTTAQCPGYSASKAGVVGLMKQLAADFAPDRMTVNAIAPSGFLTDIAGGMMRNEVAAQPMLARQPWHDFVGPESAIGTALYLASPASDHVTGHLLALDGGYLAV
ncbi:SDR family NAD(P)-dependent oxidoreductase [Williamsia soli]|uniref:SDR family NAD(P)-dependent oxidoreductase n=1 Tax=Williamsia soli TaxID=364929 RepID=UPI001A9D195D|nr:SDR family oxidoreductase [Williamsia soli]